MQTFDFIDSLMAAYGFLWRNRRIVAALAFVPVLIKIACFIVVYALGLEESWLRQGLLYLPAFFAEGVLLARLVVMAGRDGKAAPLVLPVSGNKNVMAATLAYVLIKLVLAFVAGIGMMSVEAQRAAESAGLDPQTSLGLFMASLFLMAFSLWAFRLTWLYVPLAQGYSPRAFLRRIQGMRISFVLIGLWLLCFVPMILVLVMSAGLLADIFGHAEETPSQIYRFAIIIVQSVLEIITLMLASVAVGLGVHHIMGKGDKR